MMMNNPGEEGWRVDVASNSTATIDTFATLIGSLGGLGGAGSFVLAVMTFRRSGRNKRLRTANTGHITKSSSTPGLQVNNGGNSTDDSTLTDDETNDDEDEGSEYV